MRLEVVSTSVIVCVIYPVSSCYTCDINLCVCVSVQVQYGIFPDDFTFNLLIDSYINDGDFKSKFVCFFLCMSSINHFENDKFQMDGNKV